MRSFLSLKRQEGVFRTFRPEDEVKHSNDHRRALLKFDGGSFEPIQFFSENFFTGSWTESWTGSWTGSWTESESKIHGLDQPTEVILVGKIWVLMLSVFTAY